MIFSFIKEYAAEYAIGMMCRVLKVSRSGYYAWRMRPPSCKEHEDAALSSKIERIHRDSRGTYGAPRVTAQLHAEGVRIGNKRVGRLMRQQGLQGSHRRRKKTPRTTLRDPRAVPAADLVERQFSASEKDRLWVADISYLPTWEGFEYLAFVLDAYSRRCVGWAMAEHLRAELVTDALQMALGRRDPAPGLIHHSDRGSQLRFKWSSQHRPREVLLWDGHQAGPHGSQDGRHCVLRGLRGSAISVSARESSGRPLLKGSAARTPERV